MLLTAYDERTRFARITAGVTAGGGGGNGPTAAEILADAVWLIDADLHDGNTSVENQGTGGTLTGTETGSLRFLTFDTSPGFEFPGGTATNYISCPDVAALDLSDFDIRVRVRLADWTPSAITPLVSKFSFGTTTNRSYYFRVLTGGELSLGIRNGSGTSFYTSTSATGFTDGTIRWVRVTRNSTTGEIKFYTAADSVPEPSSWTQLGTTVTGFTGALTNSTAVLAVGSLNGEDASAASCRFFHVIVYNADTGGSVVAEMCAADAPETGSWDDGSLANTWTITRPSTGTQVHLVDRDMWVFDATDDYIEYADNDLLDLRADEDACVFAVVRAHGWPNTSPILLGKRNGSGTGWNLYTNNAGGGQFNWAPGGVADIAAGPTHSGRMALIGANINLTTGDQVNVWVRGVSGTGNPVTDATVENADVMRVGASSGTASLWGAWVLIAAGRFDRTLDESEWLTLDRYFTSRAGIAANAVTYLAIDTYDGSDELVHASVVDLGSSWNGYRYWMAFTPYPNSNDDYENPSIVASADGITWVVPGGLTNPVVPFPGGAAYNADPWLGYDADNDELVMIYSEYDGTTNKEWFARTSSDGITWSSEISLFTTAIGTENPLAPSVIKTGASEWTMWYIDQAASPNTLKKRTTTTATGAYGSTSTCTVNGLPNGWDLWHMDVIEDSGGVYRGIFSICDRGANGVGTMRLLLASSSDGTTWTLRRQPVLTPGVSGAWDSEQIYHATFIEADDICRVWYSANYLPSGREWRVGYTEFPMSAFPTP